MRRALILAAAVALLLPAAPAGAAKRCPGAHTIPSPENTGVIADATLCLLNKERTLRGRKPLRHNVVLRRAASRFARKMVRQTFFSHVTPDGDTPLERIKRTSYLDGAKRWMLGENIAWGSGRRATPARAVQLWMHSAGHKANILSRTFDEIGIGVAFGAPVDGGPRPAGTYATSFGMRK